MKYENKTEWKIEIKSTLESRWLVFYKYKIQNLFYYLWPRIFPVNFHNWWMSEAIMLAFFFISEQKDAMCCVALTEIAAVNCDSHKW